MAYHPFRHLGLKAVSLVLALGLWFVVAGEETVERTMRIPLEVRNPPERLELVENPPDTATVRVRGRSDLLSHLATGDIMVMLDLSSAKAGRRYFNLSPSQVRTPFGVEVVDVLPSTISLLFEPSVTRQVAVTAVTDGDPAPGYIAGKPSVDPATVQVS
jgi:YbbR domain-containing protein